MTTTPPAGSTGPAAALAGFQGVEAERLAGDLLERTRSETATADNKAAILLAGVLAAAGGIAAAIGAGTWAPVGQRWFVALPFWAAVVASFAALVSLAAAIYPRRRVRAALKNTVVGYFGDVVELGSPLELRDRLYRPDVQLIDVWTDQIWQLSQIVDRKYARIRTAVHLLALALVFIVVLLAAIVASAG